ncbi:Integumentary mucin A.1 [Fusarium oxysporum f. sp. albedinis]|nr:Integumentary mucin A.1 [Fusarium oxysporum f. sp. albedinis]
MFFRRLVTSEALKRVNLKLFYCFLSRRIMSRIDFDEQTKACVVMNHDPSQLPKARLQTRRFPTPKWTDTVESNS